MGKRRNERIAYHEAGHAVAHWLCGVPYIWVEICDPSRLPYSKLPPFLAQELKSLGYNIKGNKTKALGRVKTFRRKQKFSDEDDILFWLSGPVCENIRFRDSALMSYLNSRHEILYIKNSYGNVDFHWKKVKALMKQVKIWRAVEALAKELVIRRRIPCEEAGRIIEDAFFSG
jgi:hypothetical protein